MSVILPLPDVHYKGQNGQDSKRHMHAFNPSKIELSFKDNSKGQKIAAALYLVSAHLSDTDMIKVTLRKYAVALLESDTFEHKRTLATNISELLSVAVLARLISEKNASILVLELRHFASLGQSEGDAVTEVLREHFGQPSIGHYTAPLTIKKSPSYTATSIGHTQSVAKKIGDSTPKASTTSNTKNTRQEQILSFINDRKSAAIKDIATLFPDVSEKTIQRELGALVASGHITKRGQKRWSVYMAL